MAVNRDNFDACVAAVAADLDITVQLGAGEFHESIQISQWSDFEPDEIANQLSSIALLRSIKQRLSQSNSAADARAELISIFGQSTDEPGVSEQQSGAQDTDDFTRLLVRSSQQPAESARLRALMQQVLTDDQQQISREDAALAGLLRESLDDIMRQVLAHPQVRRAERTCRSIYWLVSELDLDEDIDLHLIGIDPTQLDDCPPLESNLHQQLQQLSSGADGTSVELIVLDTVCDDVQDIDRVEYIASIGGCLR